MFQRIMFMDNHNCRIHNKLVQLIHTLEHKCVNCAKWWYINAHMY